MNIIIIIINTIFLATAILQTNGQLVVRKHVRALSEFGRDDSFLMMHMAIDASAGVSGSMSMMLVATDAAVGASGNKSTEAHTTT